MVQAATERTPALGVPQPCRQETLSLDPQLDVAPPGHALPSQTGKQPRSREAASQQSRAASAPPDPRDGPREGRQPGGSAGGPRGAARGSREATQGRAGGAVVGLLSPGHQTGFRGDAPSARASAGNTGFQGRSCHPGTQRPELPPSDKPGSIRATGGGDSRRTVRAQRAVGHGRGRAGGCAGRAPSPLGTPTAAGPASRPGRIRGMSPGPWSGPRMPPAASPREFEGQNRERIPQVLKSNTQKL